MSSAANKKFHITKLNVICPSNSLQHFFELRKTEVTEVNESAQGRLDEFVADFIKETENNQSEDQMSY